MKGQEIKAEERDAIFGENPLDTVSLEKPLWKQTVLIGNPIFGESFP